MAKIPCERCGTEVEKTAIGRHRGSRPCLAARNRRAATLRGLVPLDAAGGRALLGVLGIPVESIVDRYCAGAKGRRSTLTSHFYAPEAAARMAGAVIGSDHPHLPTLINHFKRGDATTVRKFWDVAAQFAEPGVGTRGTPSLPWGSIFGGAIPR